MKKARTTFLLSVCLLIGVSLACRMGKEKANLGTNQNNLKDATKPVSPANTSAETATGIEILLTKPVENGKTQDFKGTTVAVPADWKPSGKGDTGISFQSPGTDSEKITVSVGRAWEERLFNLENALEKKKLEDPRSKYQMRMIDGTLGILALSERSINNRDYLSWETFSPPDASRQSLVRYVQLSCPAGTYEQHKQLMFDILFSTNLKKSNY